jgi:5-methylcytosine-specific restriction endonuclease McrA
MAVSPRKKSLLYAKQRGACAYCGNRFPLHWLTVDHVLRKKDGGTNVLENLVLACRPCNVYRESQPGSDMRRFVKWHQGIIESL